ncbi:MAG: Sigma-70 family polymerase sigma factor [Candidatus Poribacteria bacterium]|nr:Sigma-70 family polymerase sigma factor [Candidatus Poribacteria bacterium]
MQEYQISETNNIDFASKQRGISMLNFDTSSYHFSDLDLEIAVKRLPSKQREILILHLMGHSQNNIALALNLTRSMISKKMNKIKRNLAIIMR